MRCRVLDQLHAETREQCATAEAEALEFIARCDHERYRDFLVRSFGFEAPLESACVLTPGLASHAATSRPRSRYIAQDLLDLGVPPEKLLELEACRLSPFRDLSQALGWVYVAERNVVTNSLCHRQLAKLVPELAAHASYLNCYGAATEARWHRFGLALDRTAEQADPERITVAAVETFELLLRWFEPVRQAPQQRRAAPARSSAS
jgi:heme oxygenase